MKKLVDRQTEITAIQERFAKPSSLALLYGQRRTGKTFLLQHLLRDNPDAVYFLADESTSALLLQRFHAEVRQAGRGGSGWSSMSPSDWGTLLTLLVQSAQLEQRPLFLVFDECQYLIDAEAAFPSVLQRIWDQFGSRGGLHLVLCGSALGVLSSLGDEQQPLHGRFDLRLRLQPFDYRNAAGFAPRWNRTEQFRLFGVFGGLARHLAEVDEASDLEQNALRSILDPLAALHEAAHDILRAERLSSRAEADGVLSSIAAGETVFGTIASRLGITSSRLDHTLKELQELQIVRRETRFGDRPGARYARYRCIDPFIRFWYRFVGPNRGALQGAPPQRIWQERIAPHLDGYMGAVFEEIARQAVTGGVLLKHIGLIDEAAPYWSKDHATEVDLIARSGHKLVFIECKWRGSKSTDVQAYRQLRDHASRCDFAGEHPQDRVYAVVSAGGFTEKMKQLAKLEDCILIGPEELLPSGKPPRTAKRSFV